MEWQTKISKDSIKQKKKKAVHMLCYFLCLIKAGIVHILTYVHTYVRVIINIYILEK